MLDATSQNDALEALKAFNTAITTSRLYPADAPQIPASVEKAYQAIKKHVRKNGDLLFSIENEEYMLCGVPIQKQTLGKLHGADVFQHLNLLELKYTVIRPGIDRKTFKQILTFFITSPLIIRKKGGGIAYAAQLGLCDVFPVVYSMVQVRKDSEMEMVSLLSSFPEIQEQWIDFFSKKHDDHTTNLESIDIFNNPDRSAQTLTVSIVRALQEIRKQEVVDLSPVFRQVLENADKMFDQAQKVDMSMKTAELLLQGLKGRLLGLLLAQNYSGIFGETLFAALLARVSNDDFRGAIMSLQESERQTTERYGQDSDQFHLVQQIIARLLDTIKGKQFQALEKARALIEAGEQERRSKRIQAGLNALLQGNTSVLQIDEIVFHLPSTIERLLANGKDNAAALLVENVAKELLKVNKKVQLQLSRSIGRIGEILLNARKWDWLEKLTVPLLAWVKEMEDGDEVVFEKIFTVLHHVMQYGWRVGNNRNSDQILSMFFKIRSGTIPKSESIRVLTGRIQDQLIDRTIFPSLLAQCLADPGDETLGQRFSMQGPLAARYLIATLLSSNNAGERIKILDSLANMGPLLAPVLIEQIPEPMPWFGKRNLLKLLAETGSEEHVDVALRFLEHDDLRVQREAFVCIYQISGDNRKKALLKALPLAGGTMKVQVVKALASLVDDEVTLALADLLDEQKHFARDIRTVLIKQLCRTLSHSSSKEGLEALEGFLAYKEKGRDRRLDAEVWKFAETALQQIQINRRKKDASFPQVKLPGEDSQTLSSLQSGNDLKLELITDFPEELQIRDLLERKNIESAKMSLTDLIEKTAKLKLFDQAVKLHEWLIRIDPLALAEIIRSAEIIENEKTSSIDKDHLETWLALYDILTTEEFNALYYSLEHKQYFDGSIIVKQGDIQPSLYFINSGRMKLYYNDNDGETLVKIMGRGEVVGAGTFFDASVWTINVAASGYAEISILALEKIKSWQKEYPALESKLQDFCKKFDGHRDFFQRRGKDRRRDERVLISGRVTTILLDRYGKDIGIATRGDLCDISSGGISFYIHITQKKNARLLLGRNVRVVFPAEINVSGRIHNTEGIVVAVRHHRLIHNEYTAHISFDEPLGGDDLMGIIDASKQVT